MTFQKIYNLLCHRHLHPSWDPRANSIGIQHRIPILNSNHFYSSNRKLSDRHPYQNRIFLSIKKNFLEIISNTTNKQTNKIITYLMCLVFCFDSKTNEKEKKIFFLKTISGKIQKKEKVTWLTISSKFSTSKSISVNGFVKPNDDNDNSQTLIIHIENKNILTPFFSPFSIAVKMMMMIIINLWFSLNENLVIHKNFFFFQSISEIWILLKMRGGGLKGQQHLF